MPPDPPDLDQAFDRIDAFLAVQGPAVRVEAVLALLQAVGIDARARETVGARVATLVDAGHGAAAASVLLGIVVGLFAAEVER